MLAVEDRATQSQALSHHATSRLGTGIILAGGLVLAVTAFLIFAANPVPWEDAAILFRYSENVAAGHGIVYNPGGATVDGATDMLFMFGLAALNALGMRVETAASLLNGASVGALALLVYFSWRRWAGVAAGWALIPVVIVLVGPVWQHGQAGFGTPTFAAACTLIAVVSEVAARNPRTRNLLILGLTVAFAGLVRPEGFILGPLLIVGQAFRTRSWRMLLAPSAVWLPAAAAFVGWRALYFGYPLPNPFYKKGGGTLHWVALPKMVKFLIEAALPIPVAIALGLAVPPSRRRAFSLALVLGGWTAAWLLMSDEMNLAYRFQYSILPVLLVLGAPMYLEMRHGLLRASSVMTRVALALVLAVTAGGIAYSAQTFLRPAVKSFARHILETDKLIQASPQAQVARVLGANTNGRQRTLASTEAGYVAWKSGWTVTDLWGLNDKPIAHNGYMDVAQLTQLNPEVVFAHVPTGNQQTSSVSAAPRFLPGWTGMTEPLLCFVRQEQYVLLAQWGDDGSFVVLGRPDIPDLQALRTQFQGVVVSGVRNSAVDGELPAPAGCS